MTQCAVHGCNNTLSKHARSDTCPACRRVFWYWERPSKGLAAIIVRAAQLSKWQGRMSYLGETKNPKRFRKALNLFPVNGNRRIHHGN